MKPSILLLSTLLATLLLSSSNSNEHEKFDCSKPVLLKKDNLFSHGGILDKYDNGRVFVSIQRVNNPKNWDENEYFTGKGFSKNEKDLLKVIDKDSCELKKKYFKVFYR